MINREYTEQEIKEHTNMSTLVVDLNKVEDWDKFNESMNDLNQLVMDCISELAQELNVSENCANSIYYLRTRSRHTQEKENELIRLDKLGLPLPNVFSGEF